MCCSELKLTVNWYMTNLLTQTWKVHFNRYAYSVIVMKGRCCAIVNYIQAKQVFDFSVNRILHLFYWS